MNVQTILSIIGLVFSGLTLFGFGAIMKQFWKEKHDKKKASQNDEKEKAKKERQEEIREVMRDEIAPLKEGISKLQEEMKKVKTNMVTIDRIVMKRTLDAYKAQGYASESDIAAWKELYDTYKDLGGNHFREYVGGWKDALEKLPTKDDFLKNKKQNNKSEK